MDLHHEEGTNVVPAGDLLLVQLLPPPLFWVAFQQVCPAKELELSCHMDTL